MLFEKNIFQKVCNFVSQKHNEGVLLMTGAKGTGKTHLGAVAVRDTQGHYVSMEDLIYKVESSLNFKSTQTEEEVFNDYSTVNFLVIDEVGRSLKCEKTFSSRHNDRDYDSDPEHIAKDKSDKNVIWSWCGTDISFDKGELKYYEETFGAQLEQTNQNYIKSRHKERVVTMDEWRKKTMHAPEEQILQIDRMEQYPKVEVSLSCFEEYLMWLNKWNEEHGKPFFILNWAMHQDEI